MPNPPNKVFCYPSESNRLVTLACEPLDPAGTLFVVTMHAGENRFTTEFCNALFAALDEVERMRNEEDGTPAALLTTAEGKFYSNGLDLEQALTTPRYFEDYYLPLLSRLLTFTIPTVAALNGHAFAGGCMMALAHDYRVMRSDRGYICMNEVDLHIPLHPGMAALVRIKVDSRTYRDLILKAHRFTAAEALERQFIDAIAPGDELLATAKRIAQQWAPKAEAGTAYAALKREMYTEGVQYLGVQNWTAKL